MNLEYRVLWFDDQPDSLKGGIDSLTSRLAREGFELSVKTVSTFPKDVSARLRELSREADWDLLLIDWDLGGAAKAEDGSKLDGAKLAKKVRGVFPFVDIIFYSSETPAKLRELIFLEDVDGVRCAPRGKELASATWGVVQSGIKKVIDLNHMRGIVMASVADLDQAIDDCLIKLYSKIPEEKRKSLTGSVLEKIKEVAESNIRQVEKLAEKTFDELIEHRSFSSNLKQLILNKIMREYSEEMAAHLIVERLEKYESEIIKPRNTFAHARATIENGKTFFKGRDFVIDRDAMASIRRQILDHRDNLKDLIYLLNNWPQGGVTEKVEEVLANIENEILATVNETDTQARS